MREAASDVSEMTTSIERWCPIFTPLWFGEVEHMFDVEQVKKAQSLGLHVFVQCVDDPSVKAARLNFWALFHLTALMELGHTAVEQLVEEEALAIWLDHIEALLQMHGSGYLSVQISKHITDDVWFDPDLMSKRDWDQLSYAFRKACCWMAECLYSHRLRSRAIEGFPKV